jgi:hypothetical protein
VYFVEVDALEERGLRALMAGRGLEAVCSALAGDTAGRVAAANAFDVVGRWLADGLLCRPAAL